MLSDRDPVELAEELLQSKRFLPHSGGLLDVGFLQDQLDATREEIVAALQHLEETGCVTAMSGKPEETQFETTPMGWSRREDLLRGRGLRHPALIDETFPLGDLVLALLMVGHVENQRNPGLLGMAPELALDELILFLRPRDPAVVESACTALDSGGFLRKATKLRQTRPEQLQHIEAFRITERGRRRYAQDIAPTLQLAVNQHIHDPVIDRTIRVFLSWQSEFPASRNLIKDTLKKVIKAANASKPVRPLELVQATALGDGAVRIDVQLMTLIKGAHLVVADVTPVAADNGRRRVNDNVLIEVGYALASKDPGQVLLLAMRRDDLAKGNVAFDIANVQRIELAPDGKKDGRVQAEIEAMLRRKGWLR